MANHSCSCPRIPGHRAWWVPRFIATSTESDMTEVRFVAAAAGTSCKWNHYICPCDQRHILLSKSNSRFTHIVPVSMFPLVGEVRQPASSILVWENHGQRRLVVVHGLGKESDGTWRHKTTQGTHIVDVNQNPLYRLIFQPEILVADEATWSQCRLPYCAWHSIQLNKSRVLGSVFWE